MLLDIDEVDEQCSGLVVHESRNQIKSKCSLLNYECLLDMKTLLLGHHKKDFPEEWRIQNFALKANTSLFYGLIQKKGGPCGVLACVQANIIRELYFGIDSKDVLSWNHQKKMEHSKKCLALALSHILWKCGNKIKAVVAFPQQNLMTDFWPVARDGFSEKIGLFYFNDIHELQDFIIRNITWYMVNDFVLISFIYSAILSRGIDLVKLDMDDPQIPIIGMHGYCSQEMVNLLLTGEANTNVFDGTSTLDGCEGQKLLLRGIQHQSECGLLTLMEHQQVCEVGRNYKCPVFPIWVVCSESHFSVLFTKKQNNFNLEFNPSSSPLDLFYYDGLIGQEDEIHLTLSYTNNIKITSGCLVPPLEHCIRTKWKHCVVNWNGNEPIL